MTVTNKKKPIIYKYHLDTKELLRKDNIKYLGVFIDNKLSFDQHITEKCNKNIEFTQKKSPLCPKNSQN